MSTGANHEENTNRKAILLELVTQLTVIKLGSSFITDPLGGVAARETIGACGRKQ